MTPRRLALIIVPTLPLLLAACGDGQGGAGSKRESPSAPAGFELAFAGLGTEPGGSDDTAAPAPAPAPLVTLSPEDLAARIKAGNVRLIDVRTDAEVTDGVISGAEHIPLDRFDPAKLDLSDGREVVLYCRSGRRSAIAGEKLAAVTGEPVAHLEGGMLAWEAAGQPVDKQP